MFANELRKQLRRSIESELEHKQISKSVLSTFSLRDIVEKEITGVKERERLLKLVSQLDLADSVFNRNRCECADYKELFACSLKIADRFISDLIRQNLSEYYFLETNDITEPTSDNGSVVLLRRMQTIDTALMEAIARGVKSDDYIATDRPSPLVFEHEALSMITGVLRSPDIEHLTQSFSSLYVRIGLEDQTEHAIRHYTNTIRGS